MLTQPGRVEVSFYPDDLFPQLRRALATLADIEIRYEIERDHLESRSGPKEEKERLLAELERRYRASREPLVSRLEGWCLKGRGLEPAAPRRTDH